MLCPWKCIGWGCDTLLRGVVVGVIPVRAHDRTYINVIVLLARSVHDNGTHDAVGVLGRVMRMTPGCAEKFCPEFVGQ